MSNLLTRYKLLVFSIVVLLFSVGVLVIQLNRYNSTVNYFGNSPIGNGFWLHPQNKIVKAVKRYESFKGILSALDRIKTTPGYFALGIIPYKNAPVEEHLNIQIPIKIDLKNAYMFDSKDLTSPPVQLTTSLVDVVPLSSIAQIDLQSNWNSLKYEEVTKLIVWKE